MPRAKLPLSAFDPRYKDLLVRGAREDFRLPLRDRAEGTRLRQDIHRYRVLYREVHKDEAAVLYQCLITVEGVGEENFLRFRPRSSQFSALDNVPKAEGLSPAAPVSNSLLDDLEKVQPEKDIDNGHE